MSLTITVPTMIPPFVLGVSGMGLVIIELGLKGTKFGQSLAGVLEPGVWIKLENLCWTPLPREVEPPL